MRNKILKIAGLIFLCLTCLCFAAPFVLKGKIVHRLKSRLNANLSARVSFTESDISWLRHFPRMAVGLDEFQITGLGEFSSDTLVVAKQVDLSFSLLSLLYGDSVSIYSVTVQQPRINLLVHKNGHRNWNITYPNSKQSQSPIYASKKLKWDLHKYMVFEGSVNYKDEMTHTQIQVIHLNHEALGNFASEFFTLKTKTSAEIASLSNLMNMTYPEIGTINMDINFQVDNKAHTYSFSSDQVLFNTLKLRAQGSLTWAGDSACLMDVHFSSASQDFKSLLSAFPYFYQKDIGSIQASGEANVDGIVRGKLAVDHLPSYHIVVGINNASFRYADLPKSVQHISLVAQLDNPDGLADHSMLSISKGRAQLGDDSINFRLLLKTPLSDPYIDAAVKTRVDLAKMSEWARLEPGTKLKGNLHVDAFVKGSVLHTEKKAKGSFSAGGFLDLQNFAYASFAHPKLVSLNELLVNFYPTNILVNEFTGEYLNSHFTGTGTIENLFGYAYGRKSLGGSLHFSADQLDVNDWLGINQGKAAPTNSFASQTPLVVPSDVNLEVTMDLGKFHFDSLDMQNLSGRFQLVDQGVRIEHIQTEAWGGELAISGLYSTKLNRKAPQIDLNYDANGINIQNAFNSSSTMQQIMPLGKFLSGRICAQLNLHANLDPSLTPDPGSLSGKGNVLLVEGALSNFGPLDDLADSLGIRELKNVAAKGVKTYFDFSNKQVHVNSFAVKMAGLDMEIAGSHGFDQSLDYAINLNVPKKQLGKKGKAWVKSVIAQAAYNGVPIKLSNDVQIKAKMSGTIDAPVVKTDMNEAVDQATVALMKEVTNFVNAKLDSAKHQLDDPLPASKRKVVAKNAHHSKSHYKVGKGAQLAHNKSYAAKTKKKM